jgi:hypothetical protein
LSEEKERKRKAIRGSFEDVCDSQEMLLKMIEDPMADWNEIEGLLNRAFCGFMSEELESFLDDVRKYRLENDPGVRMYLKILCANNRNLALRRSFELSKERKVGGIEVE